MTVPFVLGIVATLVVGFLVWGVWRTRPKLWEPPSLPQPNPLDDPDVRAMYAEVIRTGKPMVMTKVYGEPVLTKIVVDQWKVDPATENGGEER